MRDHELLAACLECGLVSAIPHCGEAQRACCPRCGHTMIMRVANTHQKVLAYSVTALVLLAMSCFFPFIAMNVEGLKQDIILFNALSVFRYFDNDALAALLVLTVIVLPAFYLIALMALFAAAGYRTFTRYPGESPWVKRACRFVIFVKHWLLVEIFLVGVLVSIVKIASHADITMGTAFWTFMLFSFVMVKVSRVTDHSWLWCRLFPPVSTGEIKPGDSHLSHNHCVCKVCEAINPFEDNAASVRCVRCNTRLPQYNPQRSVTISTALLVTAVVFYAPANLYAMMYTTSFGSTEASTIMDGVILLWQLGSYPIALIILIASVIVPMTKMLILGRLLISTRQEQSPDNALANLKLFRFIEMIGPWSMIDVFVVALLSALVQFEQLMNITPGPAVLYFALVVVFTLIATGSFDPRMLWSDSSLRHRSPSETVLSPGD